MPVKMIAVGRYYDRHAGMEYKNGDPFSVADEVTAARLERTKKAKRDTATAVAKPSAPTMKNKVMRAEVAPDPTPAVAPEPAPSTQVAPASTEDFKPLVEPESRPNRYRRNDMRSED